MSKLEEYAALSLSNEPLHLYFVVPDAVFPDFIDAQPYLTRGGKVQQKFTNLQKAVKQRIQQFALAIDVRGPL